MGSDKDILDFGGKSHGVFMNFSFMMIMRLMTAMLSFLLILYIARQWGATDLGKFSLLFSIFIFFQQMSLLGLHIAVIRDTAGNPENSHKICINAMLISLIVSTVLFFAIGFGGTYFYRHEPDIHQPLWLVAATMFPTSLIVVAESILIGLEKTKSVAAYNIVETLFRAIPCIIAIFLGYGLTTIFVIFLLGRFITAFSYLKFAGFYKAFLVPITKTQFKTIPSYLRQIPVLFGILLFSVCIERLDVFMLSALQNLKEVGLYSAPYKIYELGLMIPTLMALVLAPVLSSHFKENIDEFNKLIMIVLRFILLSWAPVIVLLAYYAPALIALIFGAEYADSSVVLQLLLPGLIFVGIANMFSVSLIVSNKAHVELKILALVATGYAIQLLFFIPQWVIAGAASATLITALLHPIIVYLVTKSHFDLADMVPIAFKTLLAAACMWVMLLSSSEILGYYVSIPISLAAYLLLIIAGRLISTDEIKNIKTAITLKVAGN